MTFYVGDVIHARDSEGASISWACTVVTTSVGADNTILVDWNGRQPENSRAIIQRHWVVDDLDQRVHHVPD